MSYMNLGGLAHKLRTTRSVKSLARNFLLPTMAGQKLFLYNERLPRVVNLSFNEKTCFYKCRMCLYSEADVREHYREKSEMDFETLKHIVLSIPNDPYHSFDISAVGETLEFGKLPEFVAYMKRERPLVNTIVSTNGVLLDEKTFLALARAGLDNLQVSFFAENDHDHEFITGTSTFARVSENLERACRLKREHGLRKPFIQTFILESKETAQTTQRFLDRWSPLVDRAFVRPLLKRSMDIKGMTPMYDFTPSAPRRPCMQPWYSTALNSKGEVLPCYGFHWHESTWLTNFGNINDASLAEIWRGKTFQAFRQKHLRLDIDDLPVCKNCISWNDYTNIWEHNPDGSWRPAPLRIADFLTPAGKQRGG
ncbi:MAG: SPASM domain-containing protein [Desulfovibrio sp.]